MTDVRIISSEQVLFHAIVFQTWNNILCFQWKGESGQYITEIDS